LDFEGEVGGRERLGEDLPETIFVLARSGVDVYALLFL
jgi:hypothetical protein